MRIFECQNCGEQAGKRILHCQAQDHGACPYKSVTTRIPLENEDFTSLLLVFAASIFLLSIYPKDLGNDSFLIVALNLGFYSSIVVIAIFSCIALLTVTLGKQHNVVSRKKGQLWQCRSVKDYNYFVRIISEMQQVNPRNLSTLANSKISYLNPSEQDLLLQYASGKDSKQEQVTVTNLLAEVLEVLIYRLMALNIITLKRGSVYISTWKKVEDHSDSKVFFIFLNNNKERETLELSNLEARAMEQLILWNEPKNSSENFLAPDIKEFLGLIANQENLKNLARVFLQLCSDSTSATINRATALEYLKNEEERFLQELERDIKSVFYISGSRIKVLISRLGFRLRGKQVRVAIVASCLILFFILRLTSPMLHAGKIGTAVKNFNLNNEISEFDNDVGELTEGMLGDRATDSSWTKLKNYFLELFSWGTESAKNELQVTDAEIQNLVNKLQDSGQDYKLLILDLLQGYRGDLSQYVNDLTLLLQDQSDQVKIKTLELLSELKGDASEAVDDVAKMLEDQSSAVQKEALKTLGDMGEMADPAVPEILKFAIGGEAAMVPYAADALRSINTPQAQQALRSLKMR